MTKLLLTSIAALFLATGTAHAANITWEWNENIQSPIIFIRGKLVDEDVTTFKSALGEIAEGSGTANKRIWVDLISPGGAISAGLNIGGLIAYYGMGTVVAADKSQCLSACGLIWLAGNPRAVANGALVGFHAAWRGKGEVSSDGNALVGAYLNHLGFDYRAIRYFTQAAPDSIEILTEDKAAAIGLKAIFYKSHKIDTSSHTPETYCPSGQVPEPCR
jgi:hypothetical protein